jgi:hypothetical protein
MGHSELFRDAEWLARIVLHWLFGEEPPPERLYFALAGIATEVALLRQPLGRAAPPGERGLSIRFTPAIGKRGRAFCSYDFDNRLKILSKVRGPRFEAPQRLRRAMRKALSSAKAPNGDEASRQLASFSWLRVDRQTTPEEFMLQLVIVFSRWGFGQITEQDKTVFLRYLRETQREPDRFADAAEEALSWLFTNWLLPQDPRDFRRYAKQTVWALHRKGRHYGSQVLTLSRSPSHSCRAQLGPRRHGDSNYVPISRLACISKRDPRRIYEAVLAHELHAVKLGSSLWIEESSAQRFVNESLQRHAIQELRAELVKMGKSRAAIRKRVYRLKKKGRRTPT